MFSSTSVFKTQQSRQEAVGGLFKIHTKSYGFSSSMPKETESISSESTVSLLDRLKAPTRSELSRKRCVHNGHNGD